MRFLELAVSVAYWWLPMVRSIGRRMRSCEEACCDAAVVARMPRARRDYARLLLDVVEFADPLPRHAAAQATAMSAAEDLGQRLVAILDGPTRERRRVSSILLVTGLACLMPFQVGFALAAREPASSTSRECEAFDGCPPFPAEQVRIEAFRCP